ncbi:MAG: transcription antitermination factor NusB [Eubacteriaceae bacterium]|nr:transcription antitermination factor NusB [Eubacteriaceae bacterium]
MSRKFAREIVLKTVFQIDFQTGEDIESFRNYVSENFDLNKEDQEYVEEVVTGIFNNKEALEKKISEHLVNWSLDRLNMIDAAILRIAAYEIVYKKEIPKAVVINEALNLINKYSDESSLKYVNAVLDKLDSNEIK